MDVRLTNEQIAFFNENGYIILDQITTPEEIEKIRAIYDDLFTRKVGREEGNQFDLAGTDDDDDEAKLPQILSPAKYAPELRETLYWKNAAAIARQLLGEETEDLGDHAIMKPPQHGAATPWHQDEAYWDPAKIYNTLSVWMPLQPVTVENGCMHFLPSSREMEVQPHHPINNDPRIHGLEIDEIDSAEAVPAPIPAGGATIHLSRTPHYAGPNRADEPRRAYILTFGTPPQDRETPRDFYWLAQRQTARDQREQAAKGN